MNGRLIALTAALTALLPACEPDPCRALVETCSACENTSLATNCGAIASQGDPVVCESVKLSYEETCAAVGSLYTGTDGSDGSDGTGGTSETDGSDGSGGTGGGTDDSGFSGIEQ